MMLVIKKSDPKNGQTKLRSNYIVNMIQEDCYDENLSLIPEKIEVRKMRFLGKSIDSFSGDVHHKARKATCLGKLHSLSFYPFSLRIYLKDLFKFSSTSTL